MIFQICFYYKNVTFKVKNIFIEIILINIIIELFYFIFF